MTIETKYNPGDMVLIINDSKIIKVPVQTVEFDGRDVVYTLLISKSSSLMDKDRTDIRNEDSCFKSLDEIKQKYALLDQTP